MNISDERIELISEAVNIIHNKLEQEDVGDRVCVANGRSVVRKVVTRAWMGLLIDVDGVITEVELKRETIHKLLRQDSMSHLDDMIIDMIEIPYMDNIRIYYIHIPSETLHEWKHCKYFPLPRNRYSDLFDHPLHGKIIAYIPHSNLSKTHLLSLWARRIF